MSVTNRKATTFWDYSGEYECLEPSDFVRIHKNDLRALLSAAALALSSLVYPGAINEKDLREALIDVLQDAPNDLRENEGRGNL